MYPYIMQGPNIIVVIDGQPKEVSKSHPAYEKIKSAIFADDEQTVKDLIDVRESIVKFSEGRITIDGETVFFDGREFHNALAKRMVAIIKEGGIITPLVRFMENLSENPSMRAVNELYGFLENNNLPITEDGHFLAYKKVNGNFMDVYSGTVLNTPASLLSEKELEQFPMTMGMRKEVTVSVEQNIDGVLQTVVSMPRNFVDDNRDNTCSQGLHFCSISYLSNFGGEKTIIVKVNPADVVSIPSDYNNSKGRCSRYVVQSELKVSADKAFNKAVQNDALDYFEPSDDENYNYSDDYDY